MTDLVRITEVAPRDGLQAEATPVPTERKADLVRAAESTGVDEIEVSSFVSPKWVPQLGDAAELFEMVADTKPANILYSALIPNQRGLEGALTVNDRARELHGIERLIDKVSVFTAASEAFSLKNTNASIAETIERFRPVVPIAHEHGLRVRGYISCIVRCPHAGDIGADAVGEVAEALLNLGVDELDLGDTIGAATPENLEPIIVEVVDRLDGRALNDFGDPTLTVHLHDTFGTAGECAVAAMELGVRSFDSSAGGLGGCPYASVGGKRAPGNISTRVLAAAIEKAGLRSGINHDTLLVADRVASELIG